MTRRYKRIDLNRSQTRVAQAWFAWVYTPRLIRWYALHEPARLAIAVAESILGRKVRV